MNEFNIWHLDKNNWLAGLCWFFIATVERKMQTSHPISPLELGSTFEWTNGSLVHWCTCTTTEPSNGVQTVVVWRFVLSLDKLFSTIERLKEEISNGNFLQTAANFNCFEQLQLTFSGTFCWWWYWIFLFHLLLHCLLFFSKLLLYTMNFASVCVYVFVCQYAHMRQIGNYWRPFSMAQHCTKTALGL